MDDILRYAVVLYNYDLCFVMQDLLLTHPTGLQYSGLLPLAANINSGVMTHYFNI